MDNKFAMPENEIFLEIQSDASLLIRNENISRNMFESDRSLLIL
jgi:hypothetical protein